MQRAIFNLQLTISAGKIHVADVVQRVDVIKIVRQIQLGFFCIHRDHQTRRDEKPSLRIEANVSRCGEKCISWAKGTRITQLLSDELSPLPTTPPDSSQRLAF